MNKVVGEQLEELLRLALSNEAHAVNQVINRYGNNARFCFNTVDWSKLRAKSKNGGLRFCYANWGGNFLDFTGCDFGDGEIILSGDYPGGVSFVGATFGTGDISFAGSTLNNADFSGASFCGKGNISFDGVHFLGRTQLNFEDLGQKDLQFGRLTRNDGRHTNDCVIEGDSFSLKMAKFGGKSIDFRRAHFKVSAVLLNFAGAELTA